MKKMLTILCLLCTTVLLGQSVEAERYRPKMHFSPASGWMSDPNGLVYYDGEYHLCYQHIPFAEDGTIPWGEMYWGHAVSRDLLHWEHLPIALAPDSLGYIFSGGCVADLNNTSGLGTVENPPLLAIFTYYDPIAAKQGRAAETQSQGLAYSTDHGRTWIKYANNPVLKSPGLADFRDPHVLWHKPTQQWIMVLTGGPSVRFYGSKDCINWNYLSAFGQDRGSHVGPWECPDIFPLQVEGSKEMKWVLLASVVNFTDTPQRLETATQYFIGDFDGKMFTSDQQETLWVDYGRDNYAGITFDNAPENRRIFVGWMHSHQYAAAAQGSTTRSWSGAATFPRELKVVQTTNGYRLTSTLVDEIHRQYGQQIKLKKRTIDGSFMLSETIPFTLSPLDLKLSFENKNPKELPACYGIRLSNSRGEYIAMGYNREEQYFYVDRTHAAATHFHDQFSSIQRAPYRAEAGDMEWRLLIDVASLELFVAGNRIVFTDVFFPSEPFDRIELFSESGTIRLKKGVATALRSCAMDQ